MEEDKKRNMKNKQENKEEDEKEKEKEGKKIRKRRKVIVLCHSYTCIVHKLSLHKTDFFLMT